MNGNRELIQVLHSIVWKKKKKFTRKICRAGSENLDVIFSKEFECNRKSVVSSVFAYQVQWKGSLN